jgi:hypothetical protein
MKDIEKLNGNIKEVNQIIEQNGDTAEGESQVIDIGDGQSMDQGRR